jgi:hypothetical protein
LIKNRSYAQDCGPNILTVGLIGLIIGFVGSFVDTLVSTQMSKAGTTLPEIATALLVFVPLGCLGGVVFGGILQLLRKIHERAHDAVIAAFPYAWIFLLFVFLAI